MGVADTAVDGGVAALSRRVLGDLDRVADSLRAGYAEVPEYAALGDAVMRTEVIPVSRRIVAAFFTALLEGREPDVAEVHELEDMGRRRLAMGVPLEPMLHVYR